MQISFAIVPFRPATFVCREIERFSNSRAVANSVQGGFFPKEKPLSCVGFGVLQLANRHAARRDGVAVDRTGGGWAEGMTCESLVCR
jgi:hypothetical protein